MQYAIGDHALLADGRSAALVDPAGNVAWLCMPRFDATPCLLSLLDEQRGGRFEVRPSWPGARVVSRRYRPASLVLETVWAIARQRLTVDDALTWEDGSLTRRLRAEGDSVEVDVFFAPAFDMGRAPVAWHRHGQAVTASGAGAALTLTAPGVWRIAGSTAASRFSLGAGHTSATVALSCDAAERPSAGDGIDSTLAAWRHILPDASRLRVSERFAALAGEATVRDLLLTSAALLLGLCHRSGGIVAAPTSSLPQWPASARTWDYRYCWTRDGSLAARALLRAGLTAPAARLAGFLGDVAAERGPGPCSVVRVDGGDAPAEETRPELSGYRGARPVRTGNAAAEQAQLDVPGELLELAADLAAAAALPASLAAAGARLADWLAGHWREPDHGIWEIRGPPRRYTHSRVMAAIGLSRAATLAAQGSLRGDGERWQRAAAAIRHDVMGAGGAALELHRGGGGADAALAAVPLTGFLPAGDATVAATLDLISARLARDGLLERYEGRADGLADPCAPFVFPAFWMASALRACGRDASGHITAALAARGAFGLWGEVADPGDHSPLGNYPQVQSHAAFVMAATE